MSVILTHGAIKKRLGRVQGDLSRARASIGAIPEPYYSPLLDRIDGLLHLLDLHRREMLAAMIAEEEEVLDREETKAQDAPDARKPL